MVSPTTPHIYPAWGIVFHNHTTTNIAVQFRVCHTFLTFR